MMIDAFEALMNDVCEHLPDGWELFVVFRNGEADIELYNAKGEEVTLCDDDLNVTEMLQQRVDFARATDGLAPYFDKTFSLL